MNTAFQVNPITVQGALMITVIYRDKVSLEYVSEKEVPRAFLAKMYHEGRVSHSVNGLSVIDI